MNRLEPKHPRAIRWFHWVNIPFLTILKRLQVILQGIPGLLDQS
jgi:hypothetical protein